MYVRDKTSSALWLVALILGGSVLMGGCTEKSEEQVEFDPVVAGETDVGVMHRRKREIIEAKSRSFPYVARLELEDPLNEESYEVHVFRNDYNLDSKTLLEVEALLPDVPSYFYEAWLYNESDIYVSLGALSYQGPQMYQLMIENEKDIATLSGVLISRDSVADDVPDTVVARGVLGEE